MVTAQIITTGLEDIRRACALLTRIPCKADFSTSAARSAWAFPLIGLLVGSISLITALTFMGLGANAEISAIAYLATTAILTGALHEDGLADCLDGFWGGWTQERRLEIMKDSQIGSYGVLGLICVTGLRGFAIAALLPVAPLVPLLAAAASRGAMPCLMYGLPNARASGLSHQVGQTKFITALAAASIAIVCATLISPWAAILGAACVIIWGGICMRKIGGQTGDCLGASQQLVEATLLVTASAIYIA